MIVTKKAIVDLQAFLMFAATEFARVGVDGARSREAYAGSSGLDYALVLASENEYGTIDDDSDAARAIRSTMTSAVASALDALEDMLATGDGTYDAFLRRIDARGVAASIRGLCDRRIATGDDLAFRALTIASDLREGQRRPER